MATQRGGKKPTSKASGSGSDFYIPPVPLAVVSVRKSVEEDIMGWIFAVILVAFFLPLGAFLYLDILEAKNETKKMLEKVERIEKRIERKQRDKDRNEPKSISDNPVFDRVRRPL